MPKDYSKFIIFEKLLKLENLGHEEGHFVEIPIDTNIKILLKRYPTHFPLLLNFENFLISQSHVTQLFRILFTTK